MKLSILIFLLLSAANAHASTYHRFWRGMKSQAISMDAFANGLNSVFIPATVETGAGKGLLAYEPILLESMDGMPDEIALVSYESLDAYNALYSTDAGKAYQNLHWQYFDKATSHSLTPQAYIGIVASEQAYDIFPSYSKWKENKTTVLVYNKNANESAELFLQRANEHLQNSQRNDNLLGVFDRVVLVADSYWIEYVSSVRELTEQDENLRIPVASESPTTAKILVGRGVNLQF